MSSLSSKGESKIFHILETLKSYLPQDFQILIPPLLETMVDFFNTKCLCNGREIPSITTLILLCDHWSRKRISKHNYQNSINSQIQTCDFFLLFLNWIGFDVNFNLNFKFILHSFASTSPTTPIHTTIIHHHNHFNPFCRIAFSLSRKKQTG